MYTFDPPCLGQLGAVYIIPPIENYIRVYIKRPRLPGTTITVGGKQISNEQSTGIGALPAREKSRIQNNI